MYALHATVMEWSQGLCHPEAQQELRYSWEEDNRTSLQSAETTRAILQIWNLRIKYNDIVTTVWYRKIRAQLLIFVCLDQRTLSRLLARSVDQGRDMICRFQWHHSPSPLFQIPHDSSKCTVTRLPPLALSIICDSQLPSFSRSTSRRVPGLF